jgi:AhpD family alkylhydroperoxidase
MSSPFPAGRIQLDEVARKPMMATYHLQNSIELDITLANLVRLRASLINGCAFCIDMHWKDARAAGESEERLYSLNAWRESPLYEERERAALALTEAITLIADGHLPDEIWDEARAYLSESELANLVFETTAINAWNRLMITARVQPGLYRAGMLEATA